MIVKSIKEVQDYFQAQRGKRPGYERVRKWLKAADAGGGNKRGKPGHYDIEKIERFLDGTKSDYARGNQRSAREPVPTDIRSGVDAGVSTDARGRNLDAAEVKDAINRQRLRREKYEADLAKIKRDKERGLLILKEEVEGRELKIAMAIKHALESIPRKIADRVANHDAIECEAILEQEVEDVLKTMETMLGA